MIPITRTCFDEAEERLLREVLASGWVAQGPMVERFERAFAEEIGCPHAVAVTSCTAALHLLMVAMGVRAGDEVLVPAFTWVATANAVELVGGTPVFVDIDAATFAIDAQLLAAAVTPRTVGILPVHLFGLCADMTAVGAVARDRGLWVIEDAACALGSTWQGAKAGTMGEAGCFSFHPRKSITTGEGGMITTGSARLADLCRSLRNHGAEPGPGHMASYPRPGFNYRMTDLQGALGVAQMAKLAHLLAERRRLADAYARALHDAPGLLIPHVPPAAGHSYQSYVCMLRPPLAGGDAQTARDRLIAALAGEGISTRQGTHAPALLGHYRGKYALSPAAFPATCAADALSLALPLYPGMAATDLARVVDRLLHHHREIFLQA